eukprot:1364070-Rhodomonas_salina.1
MTPSMLIRGMHVLGVTEHDCDLAETCRIMMVAVNHRPGARRSPPCKGLRPRHGWIKRSSKHRLSCGRK